MSTIWCAAFGTDNEARVASTVVEAEVEVDSSGSDVVVVVNVVELSIEAGAEDAEVVDDDSQV